VADALARSNAKLFARQEIRKSGKRTVTTKIE
jgi:hypothetical protein